MNILVTGGCGFIGSNFLRCFVPAFPEHSFINLDSLTYAANPKYLLPIIEQPNYTFVQGSICDASLVGHLISRFNIDHVVNFAAESHVDNSIRFPDKFVETNIRGVFSLLETCRLFWDGRQNVRFLQVSTDEVYGELTTHNEELFTEKSPLCPSSPYSATKGSADMLVQAYYRTYGLPTLITHSANNYGANQHVEKFIPKMIKLVSTKQAMTLHGDGSCIRDWLHVLDNCRAVWEVLTKGTPGERYNVSAADEWTIKDIANEIYYYVVQMLGPQQVYAQPYLTFFHDPRPGCDWRYGVDSTKIRTELGWEPKITLEQGLPAAVEWFLKEGA